MAENSSSTPLNQWNSFANLNESSKLQVTLGHTHAVSALCSPYQRTVLGQWLPSIDYWLTNIHQPLNSIFTPFSFENN
ncbi:hypothetical protein SUGI_0561290 [Cryptomeria japonica]|nr:hypothetical protein SUGI_0561290 [Cryptomeria japonica]